MNGHINRKFKLTLILTAAAAALTAAVFVLLYYAGAFLPGWAKWTDVEITGNEGEPDRLVLKDKKVRIYKDGKCIFESPDGCRVQNMLYADIDRDGEREILLLNFNIGKFGKRRPFWVEKNEKKWFQHIYIYDYRKAENTVRPIWMASEIGMDASDFYIKNGSIIVMEDKEGELSEWEWKYFGLVRIER